MIIAALIGLLGSALPHAFDIFGKWQDNKQELAILSLQMQAQAQVHTEKMQEINANADIAETATIYKTYSTGIDWIDALNGLVRPVLAFSFFALYCFVKYANYQMFLASNGGLPWLNVSSALWAEMDMEIFVTILCYYFGNRTFQKLRDAR